MGARKPGLVLVCDYWDPMSANVVCVEALLPVLTPKYDVTVMATARPSSPPEGVEFVGVGDIGINGALSEASHSKFAQGAVRLGYKAVVARNLFRFPLRSAEWARRFEGALRSVLSGGGVRLVVPVSYPAESVAAAASLASEFPDVAFVAWFLDATSVGMYRKGRLVRSLTSSLATRFERRAVESLDGAVFLGAAEGLVLAVHGGGNPKVRFADAPFMSTDSVVYRASGGSGPFSILYAGTLADPDRNPSSLIRALEGFCEGGAELRFAGDDAGLLDRPECRRPYVKRLGFLSTRECDEAMRSVDALLSIGNRDPHLVPSKVFRYMAMGKPIVHVRRGEGDSCLPYLERYPLALVVDDGDPEKLARDVTGFRDALAGMDGLVIPLRELFPEARPEYTVGLFESFVKQQDAE